MQPRFFHCKGIHPVECVALIVILAVSERAQTVVVDATPSHVANTFSPLKALGTTLDRIPSNTTDIFFRPDQVKQILEAGWGPISYRQNTELFVQAWHWNPKGRLERSVRKGLFCRRRQSRSGNDSPFVWLLLASSRSYAKQRHGV